MSPGSATGVLMRYIPEAISSIRVPDCWFVIMSSSQVESAWMCNERTGRYTSKHVFARTRHFVCSAHGLRGSRGGRRRGARAPHHRFRARARRERGSGDLEESGSHDSAQAEICRRRGPRIRLYALKPLRNEAAAADLMQDVLVMVLQKLRDGAVRDREQVVSFVLGTARQMVIDGRRGARRRVQILEAFPVDLTPADEEAPAPPDTRRLGRCILALHQRERTVLVLTFYDDRSADAVAAELGLSAGNVRVIRPRGLERWRDGLEAAGGEA